MSMKRNNMPRFDFVADDEFEDRTVKLSKAKWAMLDKYCEFVEKKTDYRPSVNKVFDKLLDNLFGTDKAFRYNAGLIRAKKPNAKSKPEEDAQETLPEGKTNRW